MSSVIVRTASQLGPLLKQFRKSRQWSQSQLGEKIGLSQERVATIENHPERITVDQLLTVLMTLEVELSLIDRSDVDAANPATTEENW
jgi:HTH-type transcriptional regulator/antitoxin HipB